MLSLRMAGSDVAPRLRQLLGGEERSHGGGRAPHRISLQHSAQQEFAEFGQLARERHFSKENIKELSGIFCKIFDPDMSPLAFELDEMYR